MKRPFNQFLILLSMLLFLGSCVSNKKILYLQDTNNKLDTLFPMQPNNYRLQTGDIIGINIKLPTENDVLREYLGADNRGGMNMGGMGQGGGDIYYMTGYTLDDSGFVNVPLVGKINIVGYTIFEANDIVQRAFDEYISNSLVQIRLGGIRYTILGEVNGAGHRIALRNRLTIFEAIAMSGDLTEMARRDKVVIYRQYPDGTRRHEINLLDEKLISSPFYFVQNNDFIYVEPLKTRVIGSSTNALSAIQIFFTFVSLVTSTVAIIRLTQG